jgi:hypothetical protein
MTWQVKVVRVALALGVVATLGVAAGAGWVDWLFFWF